MKSTLLSLLLLVGLVVTPYLAILAAAFVMCGTLYLGLKIMERPFSAFRAAFLFVPVWIGGALVMAAIIWNFIANAK